MSEPLLLAFTAVELLAKAETVPANWSVAPLATAVVTLVPIVAEPLLTLKANVPARTDIDVLFPKFGAAELLTVPELPAAGLTRRVGVVPEVTSWPMFNVPTPPPATFATLIEAFDRRVTVPVVRLYDCPLGAVAAVTFNVVGTAGPEGQRAD